MGEIAIHGFGRIGHSALEAALAVPVWAKQRKRRLAVEGG